MVPERKPNNQRKMVGPDLRAGRLLAGSPVLDGRLGDPPLPWPKVRSPCAGEKYMSYLASISLIYVT